MEDLNNLTIGEEKDSVILGQRVRAVLATKKSRCSNCAFHGMCNGTPDYVHIRRTDVGNCSSKSRKDNSYIRFETVKILYTIPEKIKSEVNIILLSNETGKQEKALNLLTEFSLSLDNERKPGDKFFSKLLGNKVEVCVWKIGGGRCRYCAYEERCLNDTGFYHIRQKEAGHCSMKSRKDNENIYYHELSEEPNYIIEPEILDDLKEIERSNLNEKEKLYYQFGILEAVYNSKINKDYETN